MMRLGFGAVTVGLVAFFHSATARAADVTIAWDPNTEPDLAGYHLYYDTDDADGPYIGQSATEGWSPVDVPLESLEDPGNPRFTLHGLPSCQRVFIAVTAYNRAALESTFSNRVEGTLIASPNPVVVTSDSPTSLTVGWAPLPANDTGSIPRFLVHYGTQPGRPDEGAGSPREVVSSELYGAPSVVLSGLRENTTYWISVEAVCPDGESKRSTEVAATSGVGQIDAGAYDAGATGGKTSRKPGVGAAPPEEEEESSSGCGCLVVGSGSFPAGTLLLVTAAIASFSWRRRRGGVGR